MSQHVRENVQEESLELGSTDVFYSENKFWINFVRIVQGKCSLITVIQMVEME